MQMVNSRSESMRRRSWVSAQMPYRAEPGSPSPPLRRGAAVRHRVPVSPSQVGMVARTCPLSQPPQPAPHPSVTNTLRNSSCPGTPELQRRREEAVKRLATK
ncbi:hypothetical protein SKAU_G00253470 [Synaphobranchus kaupii]|uniref:Uncharacterized protein n=1 Tax=Synaphobranchus kaupii TaxID=118154 RepID=A0A9Q1F3A8_SYNKA|nr:hypothetical protein SKAU_G00253470 [Synaphobranchus kaupii]